MIELIAFIIFLISVLGIFVIVAKKLPMLAELPKNGTMGFKKHHLIARVETKLKDTHFHIFQKQVWLHKLLSMVKVWTLKAEVKIDHLLHGIRKKAQELDKDVKNKK